MEERGEALPCTTSVQLIERGRRLTRCIQKFLGKTEELISTFETIFKYAREMRKING